MLRKLSIAFILACFIAVSIGDKTRYDRYRLLKIQPRTEDHLKLISEWQHDPEFDAWNRIKGVDVGVDVLLSPTAYLKYKRLFDAHNIQFKVMESNIQNRINEEDMQLERMRVLNGSEPRVVNTYARYADIVRWLEMVAAANPQYVTTRKIGQTIEGRDMVTLVLKTATSQKAVWIDCGIHAREWISPATCISIIEKLTNEYNSGDVEARAFLGLYEVHFLPVHNPDGYEFTQTTRLWRKNRRRNTGSTCLGVDLNRNFGYKWLTAGASTNPCSDTYAGQSANSEPEVQNVIKAIQDRQGPWEAFITIHSYGQWFFTPWGWTTALPADYNDQLRVAQATTNAIKAVFGTTYVSGPSGVLLYLAAGCSSDWAYGVANIKHSYTIELRPGQNSPDASFGFVLPPDRIAPSGTETYAGLKAFFRALNPTLF